MIAAHSFVQLRYVTTSYYLKVAGPAIQSTTKWVADTDSFGECTEDDYDDYHKVQLLTEMSWDSEAWFIVSWKVFTDSTARLQFLRTHLRKYEVYNKVVVRKKINPSQFCEGATMAACLENVATVAWSTVKWTRCFHHLP